MAERELEHRIVGRRQGSSRLPDDLRQFCPSGSFLRIGFRSRRRDVRLPVLFCFWPGELREDLGTLAALVVDGGVTGDREEPGAHRPLHPPGTQPRERLDERLLRHARRRFPIVEQTGDEIVDAIDVALVERGERRLVPCAEAIHQLVVGEGADIVGWPKSIRRLHCWPLERTRTFVARSLALRASAFRLVLVFRTGSLGLNSSRPPPASIPCRSVACHPHPVSLLPWKVEGAKGGSRTACA